MTRVFFIINGSLNQVRRLREQILGKANDRVEVEILLTESSLDGISKAHQAILDGANYVIAVGGDGMVNEVVNGYMRAPIELRTKVALGVFSSGKGNDYIKSLGLSGELKELFELIESDKTQTVDVGLVKFRGIDGNQSQRYFNNIAEVGLGGYVMQNIDLKGTFINGFITYQKAILQTFFTYKPIKVRLESAEFTWEGPILSLILAKGKYFGSGLCIAPHAVLDDGKLGLVLLGEVSLWDYVKNLSKVKKGMKLDHPEALYMTIGDCKITPILGDCPIDMDGEFVGYSPMEICVISRAVKFLADKRSIC